MHRHKWRFNRLTAEGQYEYKCIICGQLKIMDRKITPRQVFKVCRATGWNTKRVAKILNIIFPCQFCLIECDIAKVGEENIARGWCNRCKRWVVVFREEGRFKCSYCGNKLYHRKVVL